MYSYRICGTTFQSNVMIPELNLDQRMPEFTFQLCDKPLHHTQALQWLNHWYLHDGTIWLSFARIELGYLLRFPNLVDFVVSPNGDEIRTDLQKDCPPETMRHLLLNQVIPIVLSQLGKLVLHASACATPQGVMAFMGTTGMGKSTLATSFGLRGFSVLTDDCLLVKRQDDKIMGVPSYAGLRLWPESVTALFDKEPEVRPMAHYTDKKRVLFDQKTLAGSLELKAIYVLAEPESESTSAAEVTIAPLLGREALFEIVKHTFQLDVTDSQQLGRAFKRYEWLAKSVPFFRLTFPRDHALLPIVNNTVLHHLDVIPARQPISI